MSSGNGGGNMVIVNRQASGLTDDNMINKNIKILQAEDFCSH